jgi:hypothetical protein
MVYGLYVISPVIGFLATVIPEKLVSQELDASTEASGPHDFAVRVSAVRQRRRRVHRIPSRVRDDRETPLVGTGRDRYRPDLRFRKSRIFLQTGLDRKIGSLPVGQITLNRGAKSRSAPFARPAPRRALLRRCENGPAPVPGFRRFQRRLHQAAAADRDRRARDLSPRRCRD